MRVSDLDEAVRRVESAIQAGRPGQSAQMHSSSSGC